MTPRALVVTCEHASNRIPARYQHLFVGAAARHALASHRGYDLGARELAQRLARRFGAPLVCGDASRLLVDLNRSPTHPGVFSEWTRPLADSERRRLLDRFHGRYRQRVTLAVKGEIERAGPTLHLSVHSFTPVLAGETRTAELSLLYDPARAHERAFCLALQRRLRQALPDLRVRRNYPYRGRDDGLTTALRRVFSPNRYLGVELEVNQRLMRAHPATRRSLANAVAACLSPELCTLVGRRGPRQSVKKA